MRTNWEKQQLALCPCLTKPAIQPSNIDYLETKTWNPTVVCLQRKIKAQTQTLPCHFAESKMTWMVQFLCLHQACANGSWGLAAIWMATFITFQGLRDFGPSAYLHDVQDFHIFMVFKIQLNLNKKLESLKTIMIYHDNDTVRSSV